MSTLAGSPIPANAAVTRVAGAPPADSFNMNNFTNVEGPVWIGDSLYVSEIKNGNNPPPESRILKITPTGSVDMVSVFLTGSGSNGLAVDNSGNLVSTDHGMGRLVQYRLPGTTPVPLVSLYMAKRFNTTNDLAIRTDGSIYFTDPDFQNTARPQGATRAYQVSAGSTTATIITDYSNNPNGITLSLDELSLFVSGGSGVKKYDITGSTVAMAGVAFGPPEVAVATDGMAVDCAGNLYVTVVNSTNIVVLDPQGRPVANSPIRVTGPSSVTNVAFGGSDHQTLFITGMGSSGQQGVFKVRLLFPGLPY